MANYVVTSNKLDAVKDSLKATDKVVILYKDSDTVTFQQMLNLMGSKAQKEFLSYENDNELLIRCKRIKAKTQKKRNYKRRSVCKRAKETWQKAIK